MLIELRRDVIDRTEGRCIVCKEVFGPDDHIYLYKMIQPAVIKWTGGMKDIKKLSSKSNLVYLHKHCIYKINTAALAPSRAADMGLTGEALEEYKALFSSMTSEIARYWNLINKVSQKQNNLCFLCSQPLKTKDRIVRRRNPYFDRIPGNSYVICSSCNRSLGILESKYNYAMRARKREVVANGLARSSI